MPSALQQGLASCHSFSRNPVDQGARALRGGCRRLHFVGPIPAVPPAHGSDAVVVPARVRVSHSSLFLGPTSNQDEDGACYYPVGLASVSRMLSTIALANVRPSLFTAASVLDELWVQIVGLVRA